jgi:PiT family inorganic phosphate transporter
MLEFTIFIIFVALIFDFLNGMNDAANSIATIVSTRVLSPRLAVLWAAFFNFAAAFGFGVHVATTIGKGIVNPAVINHELILSALIGAVIWTHVCTYYGLPISVSHSLIGGLAGSAVAKVGFDALVTSGLVKVGIFVFLSPLIGMFLGFVLMVLVLWIVRKKSPSRVDKIFRVGQLISSAAFSLGHGTNDAQKTMGIIAILLYSARDSLSEIGLPGWIYTSGEFYVPFWVVIIAHLTIAAGTMYGGWKVVKTMGMKLTHLQPIGGFCAETAGAFVLLGTAVAGIPVSTTHTVAGGIMGVGATRRLSAVRWGLAGKIVWAWILTIPISGLVGYGTFMVIDLIYRLF